MYRWSEWCFVKTIEAYGSMVRVVLRHQPLTLLVAIGTLGLTIYLYIIVPKGFFPVQDTGAILGISQAPETVSFPAMSSRQQELVQVIRQDPAVENLTSFIGADGVNTTMNSGRIQITLKPLEQRAGVSAVDVIRRLEPKSTGTWHRAFPAAGSGPDGGRPDQPDAIPILARRAGHCRGTGIDPGGCN